MVLGESAVCNTSTFLLETDPTRPDPDDVLPNLDSTIDFILFLKENYNLEENMGKYIEMPSIIITIRLYDGNVIGRGGNMYKTSANKKIIFFKFSEDPDVVEFSIEFTETQDESLLIKFPSPVFSVTLSKNIIISQSPVEETFGVPITEIDILTCG